MGLTGAARSGARSDRRPAGRQRPLERIDSPVYAIADPHEGPAFLLAERLTGITMTPRLLEESTYLCGVVPGSR
ncbi:DUF6461 domain-containing protein [Nonomuraea dietziae]|uniref:DUF6461 domain-containing protein n=1 Tax=Nonomuraea dietziae TaxID=65515 RepID=UPI0034139D4D